MSRTGPVVLQPVPADIVALADFERHARERMDASAWAYLNGGAADELTLRANRAAWDALQLWPRVLRDLAGGGTAIELLGRRWPVPIALAPIAYQQLAHADGELASALAAAAQGCGLVLSAQSSVAMEPVACAMRGESERGPLWFQLYWRDDEDFMRTLLQRVEAAGYEALLLTVDAPVQGARDAERRAGFALPAHIHAANLGGHQAPLQLQPGQSTLFDGLLSRAATWDTVDWLRTHSRLPLLLKGITHPDDACEAQARGAAGVVVSNHGGRTLDTVPPTAALLPRLREAVGAGFPLLVDGGIRRGSDVLKALALGADAVLLGRPYVHALAVAGAQGVALALRLLRDEFEIAMALTGCRSCAEIGPQLLWHAPE